MNFFSNVNQDSKKSKLFPNDTFSISLKVFNCVIKTLNEIYFYFETANKQKDIYIISSVKNQEKTFYKTKKKITCNKLVKYSSKKYKQCVAN